MVTTMNRRAEYKTIHQNSLRFLRSAKNLPYITEKNAIPYQIKMVQNIDITDSSIKKMGYLFQKKFPTYETNISLLAGLTFSCPSMLFQVKNKDNGALVYESIAISFSESEDMDESVSWPLLLVLKITNKNLRMNIHNFIQRTLRCILKTIELNESQTLWLIGISINETLKRSNNDGMSLTCQLPTKTSAEIDIFFNDSVISAMWESVHDCLSNVIRYGEVEVFLAQMTSHVRNVYGIDLSQLTINSFLVAGIRLQFSNQFQIKATKPEIIYLLLSFIVSDCLDAD